MSDATRTRLASLIVIFAVFVAGGVLGAVADRTFFPDRTTAEPTDASGATAAPERSAEDGDSGQRRRQYLWERVDPTEEQRAEIQTIMDAYRAEMEALQDEFNDAFNPRYRAIIDATRGSIREVFTPEQRERYDSLTARSDSRSRGDDASNDDGDGNDDEGNDAPENAPDPEAAAGDDRNATGAPDLTMRSANAGLEPGLDGAHRA